MTHRQRTERPVLDRCPQIVQEPRNTDEQFDVGDGEAVLDAPAEAVVEVEVLAEADVEGLAPPPLEEPPQAVRTNAAGISARSRGRRRADGR